MLRPSRAERSLVSQILVLALALFGGLALALALIFGGAFREHAQARTGAEIQTIAASAVQLLSDGLAERRREISVMVQSPTLWREGLDSAGVVALLGRARAVSPNSLWIGVADLQGVIVASTDGLLQGQSVAARPWFRHGLAGPYLGDVHPAVLLEPYLPSPASGDPLRFLDLAAPIQIDGRTVGVLATHLSWDWARQVSERVLPSDAAARGIELLIFDKAGALLYASGGRTAALRAAGQRLRTRPAAAAQPPMPWTERWMDNQEYLATLAPAGAGSPVAEIGWQVVVRAHSGKSFEPARNVLVVAGAAGLATALVLSIAAWFGARRLGSDLAMLTHAANRIEAGHAEVRIPPASSSKEVLGLSRALSRMTQRLIESQADLERQVAARTAELEAANAELAKQARRDPLTGLLNRRGFEPKAQLLFDLALRGGRPLCACMVDADHFKAVNDTHGHAVGDQVLKRIASCLQSRMRRTDLLARWGGEEFVLLLPDTSLEAAGELAEGLRLAIGASTTGAVGRVTVSIGLAQIAPTDRTLQALVERADLALYRAKDMGRNQVSSLAALL
ncbi:diguanylate cyclase [Pseudorhodoferax aquiterrae]|uniref:diguanylate cyclase n=1 Tax=Pseudorhodoferax aquiterrae TaxID=747304 RepID=A0ABQ3GBQ2_9BURK|nr:diguanylate cyclase [Pseudorhodoferax aquiterrae]GHC98997.1 diguanylate cyclase [Pseudorhodoferax aquiterrae]